MSNLIAMGWPGFAATLAHDSLVVSSTSVPARVAIEHADRYELITDDGRGIAPAPSDPDIRPKVGDWVLLDGQSPPRIAALLPRHTELARASPGGGGRQVMAANVDEVWILTSANHDFNTRRLERYVAAVRAAGAVPVIVVTKLDLAIDRMGRLSRDAEDVAPGVEVLLVSAVLGMGTEDLAARLVPGGTVALVGSSGVGKSTLLNHLLGAEVAVTSGIREDDSRGRHTTTHRHLHLVPDGRGVIIDMPGLRELGLADASGVAAAFPEIEALVGGCRFRDCRHEDEPDCAVLAAVDDGRIDPARLASWHKLLREGEAASRREDVRAQRAYAREWGAKNRQAQALKKQRGW